MDERIKRFRYCDPRFYPYLDRVLERLPQDVREDVLNNKGFQILADRELQDVCGRNFDFEEPVENVVYLNFRSLIQPDHRLLFSIAREIAEYVAGKEGKGTDEKAVVELLMEWGFESEVRAGRYCDSVARSPGFKAGYDWANRQSRDYLSLHFGLYFDEWNEKGLGSVSEDRLKELHSKAIPSKILPGAAVSARSKAVGEEEEGMEGIPMEEAAIEGIMAAFKELKLKEE